MPQPPVFEDGTTLTAAALNGLRTATAAPGTNIDTEGYALIFENSAPVDVDIPVRGVVFWIDQTANQLNIRLRYADGTLKSAAVNLT